MLGLVQDAFTSAAVDFVVLLATHLVSNRLGGGF